MPDRVKRASHESRIVLIAILLSCCVLPATARPQATKDKPNSGAKATSADQVIAQALESVGGTKGYRRAANARIEARARAIASQPGLEVKAEFVVYTRADGARRVEKKVMGQEEILGSDGKDFWKAPPGEAGKPLTGPEKTALEVEQVQQHLLIDYGKLGYSAKLATTAKDTQDGLIRVSFRRKNTKGESAKSEKPGDQFDYLFDAGSSLLRRIEMLFPEPWSGRVFPLVLQFDDYRKESGIPIAHRITYLRDGKPIREVTIEKIEIGKKLDDSLFRRPNPAD